MSLYEQVYHLQGPRAVLGPGTGLGEAQLIWDDRFEGYKVYASEGAHSTFAPRGDLQRQLHAFVEEKYGYVEGTFHMHDSPPTNWALSATATA